MNFSWVIPDKLAGCMGPVLREELLYLKGKGVRTIVRLEERTISGEAAGLVDMAEYVPVFCHPPRVRSTASSPSYMSKSRTMLPLLSPARSAWGGLARCWPVIWSMPAIAPGIPWSGFGECGQARQRAPSSRSSCTCTKRD